MSLLNEIVAELIGMFLGDLRLSIGVGVVVATAAAVARSELGGAVAGVILIVGCLGVLVLAVTLAARRKT